MKKGYPWRGGASYVKTIGVLIIGKSRRNTRSAASKTLRWRAGMGNKLLKWPI